MSPRAALSALLATRPRAMRLEILTVRGRNPSRQRNLAAQRARGSLLYFLDHDSLVQPGTLERLRRVFSRAGVAAAGGPNLAAGPASRFALASELVLASRPGSLTVWRRYAQGDGPPRPAGEESLILCNLMVRREIFLELGGFDPRLYPNEENEFLNRLRAKSWEIVHVPRAPIRKPRANGFVELVRETFRYARGRMEQMWINPHFSDAPYAGALSLTIGFTVGMLLEPELAWLLGVYAVAAGVAGFRLAAAKAAKPRGAPNRLKLGAAAGALIGLRHCSYAVGLFWGALSGWRKRRVSLVPAVYHLAGYSLTGRGLAPAYRRSLAVGPESR